MKPREAAIQIEQNYFVPQTPVSVISLGDGLEAALIRSILESLGAAVRLHAVGTPQDLLLTLDRRSDDPRCIVICGHGDNNGFVFGDLDEALDGGLLVEGCLPATALDGRFKADGAVLLSTACLTGGDAFAAIFLNAGAEAYIASSDYPEGADMPLFVHLFFHRLLQRSESVGSAFAYARGYDPAFDGIRLHRRGA